jgi:hypothetical protein
VKDWFCGWFAVALTTVREAQRQRLWLLFVAGMGVLAAAATGLSAVDQADRLKLAVVAQSAVVGFVAVLLAVLVPAAALRRDLEARVGFLLFAKPLAKSAYLWGRWSGVLGILAVGSAAIIAVGAATIAWRFDGLPAVRRTVAPGSWEQVSSVGQVSPIAANKRQVGLGGLPGNAVRWHFTDLPAGDQELLIKARVRGQDIDDPVGDLLVQVSAGASGATNSQALSVDPASPYGLQRGAATVAPGQAVLRDREAGRTDLAADYLRLRLPASCIVGGETTVQLTRLEARGTLVVEREAGCLVAADGGNFVANVARGVVMQLAGAGVLAAAALLFACVGNLGVALLGGLTVFLCGVALPAVREVLDYDDTGTALRRVFELALTVFPDFDRFGPAVALAAGRHLAWEAVLGAWLYAACFILPLMLLAWWALRRREL